MDQTDPTPDDDDEPRGLRGLLHDHSGVIIGVVGLVAWVYMAWQMFGDVL